MRVLWVVSVTVQWIKSTLGSECDYSGVRVLWVVSVTVQRSKSTLGSECDCTEG